MIDTAEFFFFYDDKEETETRFVSFMGEANRFDLAVTTTSRFYGKKMVFDIQSGRSALIGPDDLEEPGYLAHVFQLAQDEEEELHAFLNEVIG